MKYVIITEAGVWTGTVVDGEQVKPPAGHEFRVMELPLVTSDGLILRAYRTASKPASY